MIRSFRPRILVASALTAAIVCMALVPATAQDDPLGVLGRTFEKAAEKAAPAVVQVLADIQTDLPPGDNSAPPLKAPKAFLEKYGEARPLTKRPEGPASGVIIDPDGYVLTSLYNVSGLVRSVKVILPDGRDLKAKIVARDANRDVALLKVDASGLPALSLAEAPEAVPGQFALTLGRGDAPDELNMNAGIVSAIIRERGDAIQTSARVNYGNSGGALIDIEGRLLGIIARVGHDQTRFRSGINTGVGFAAPSKVLVEVIDRLKKGETIAPRPTPFLGIRFDPSYRGEMGVAIEYVYKGFPGDRAGLKPGDILVNFDHVDIEDRGSLVFVIRQCDPGQKVTFSVNRGEEGLDLESVLTKRPTQEESDLMALEYLLWKEPRALGVRADHSYKGPGARILHVHDGFPLKLAGLEPGEVILAVTGLRDLPGWFSVVDLQYWDRTLQYCWEGAKVTFLVWGPDSGLRLMPIMVGRHASETELASLERDFQAAKDDLPEEGLEAAPKHAMTDAFSRWLLRTNLGLQLGEFSDDGWPVEQIHPGFPVVGKGISVGDRVVGVNGMSAKALSRNPRILSAPLRGRILYLPGDRWVVDFKKGDTKKRVAAVLGAAPSPLILRLLDGAKSGSYTLYPGEAKQLESVLYNTDLAGRFQALAALSHADNWSPSMATVLATVIQDKNAAFVEAVRKALERHPSKRALEAVIKGLPVDSTLMDKPSPGTKALEAVLKGYLDKADLPGPAPDFGANGVKWQRWFRENSDRISFRD